jgi:predicted RNA-binding protein YlqC (UPF0109 family)
LKAEYLAMRIILSAASAKEKKRTALEIVE